MTRDGKPEPYHTERQHGFIRIYAGDKDVIIPTGEHTYVFRYRTGRQIRWFDGKPELNWNVTGNFWNFPISEATYRLHLAGGARPCAGPPSPGGSARAAPIGRGDIGPLGTLTVSTTRPLAPGEGLTVVAELPASAVEPPSQSTLLWYQFLDNRRWILAAAGFLWSSSIISSPGPRSAAIPRAASSFRCSIRRRASRRRSPTTSTIGDSGARSGAPSPRRRCRLRCAVSSDSIKRRTR